MPFVAPLPFVLVLARLGGLLLAAPLFGHVAVPARLRAGIAGVLALALAPTLPASHLPAEASFGTLAGLVGLEAVVGVLLGFVAQLVFAGVQLGGEIAGLQAGFGFASIVDPGGSGGATVVAHWQHLAALLAFLVLDVHHVVLRAVLESFRVAPIGSVVLDGGVLHGVVTHAGSLFATAVRLAAPVVVVLLLVQGALGVLARTMPQLHAFAVGAPVTVGVGLVVLGASLPFTAQLLADRFAALGAFLGGLVDSLGALAHG